jgi:hypothetical protein
MAAAAFVLSILWLLSPLYGKRSQHAMKVDAGKGL